MGGKRWSDEEKAALAELSEQKLTLIDNMHRLPGRTYQAVKTYASHHDLALSERHDWEQWEKDLLTDIYRGVEPIKDGVHRLLSHRGYIAAKHEAIRLKLVGAKPEGGRARHSWVFTATRRALKGGKKMTVEELMVATNAGNSAIRQVLAKHHGTKVRVAEWKRTHAYEHLAAAWQLGRGPDAPRPAPLTSHETNKRMWARKRVRLGKINPFAGLVQQVTA